MAIVTTAVVLEPSPLYIFNPKHIYSFSPGHGDFVLFIKGEKKI